VIVERHRAGIVVAIWALSALAAYLLLTDNAFPRYGLQAVAPLCILAVVGAADLVRRIAPRVRGNSSHTRAWRIGAALLVLAAVGPGLVLDLRVLANPGNAPYPGLDRSQYNVLISNTGPDENAANEILRLSPPSVTDTSPAAERTVAESGGWGSWTAHLVLNGRTYTPHPRFNFIDLYGGSPDQNLANAARFVIVDGAAPPGWFKLGRARLVEQWTRPGGGVPVQLYERG
jgi:hypothetical protein